VMYFGALPGAVPRATAAITPGVHQANESSTFAPVAPKYGTSKGVETLLTQAVVVQQQM
jgi:hypothetical protein